MFKWEEDKTNRMLGRHQHTCRICGETGEFDTYLVREMMQGTKDEFEYFVCGKCKCLQIAEVPDNLGDYYGEGYYSYQVAENPDMEFDTPVTNMTKILDVGCGAGYWLLQKAKEGYGNLYGCDPFLEKPRNYGERVHIYNCSIHEMEGDGTFDLIQLSDSFEHVTDPLEVLKSAKRLLKDGGKLRMTFPTYPNGAFDRYGTHWYQLDAPRHIFLYSKESLEWLSHESGLNISEIKYNSNAGQFIRSHLYKYGIVFSEHTQDTISKFLNDDDIKAFEGESEDLNDNEYGDHMEIYLQKHTFADMENPRNVIYQKFTKSNGKCKFPYPPIYRQPDTDYICFTDDETLQSSSWDVRFVENMDDGVISEILKPYSVVWEINPRQIQVGSLFKDAENNLIWQAQADSDDAQSLLEHGNEVRDSQYPYIALRLFAQALSTAIHTNDDTAGKKSAIGLVLSLYESNDKKLLIWRDIENLYEFNIAEMAAIAWCRESLAFKLNRPAKRVLEYYGIYEDLQKKYMENEFSVDNRECLEFLTNAGKIMNAQAMAFCSCIKTGDEEHALELLEKFSLKAVNDTRSAVFNAGLSSSDAVFNALFGSLKPLWWDMWSEEILNAWAWGMADNSLYDTALSRLPFMLVNMSIKSVIRWVEKYYNLIKDNVKEKLINYIIESSKMEDFIEKASLQQVCFYAWILKSAYENSKKDIFTEYVTLMGVFAENYYNPDYLIDMENHVVPPDVKAAYRVWVVLCAGMTNNENEAILNQAIELCPDYKDDVRNVLNGL